MAESSEKELIVEEIEATSEPTSSIDEVLDEMQQTTPRPRRSTGAITLIGEVVEPTTTERPDRVLVNWRDENDVTHERPLRFISGLDPSPGDKVLLAKPGNWPGWVVTGAIQQGAPQKKVQELDVEGLKEALDIKVDGKRLEIEGEDEVVIRCGKSSITLRRNGRVVIRGTYVESRSKGTNRIKGGSVEIN